MAFRYSRGIADSRKSVMGRWTALEAIEKVVAPPVLTQSLFARFRSRDESNYSDRMIAVLRREFGGHAVKKSD